MRECGYCGAEFTLRPYGWRRLYCTDSHRVMASQLRKAEAEHPEDEDRAVD